MSCTVYLDTDASNEAVAELRERVEARSPLVDAITNEVPLETHLVVE